MSGPTIVVIGASGPRIGESVFPKAVSSPEMIKETDEVVDGEGVVGATADPGLVVAIA